MIRTNLVFRNICLLYPACLLISVSTSIAVFDEGPGGEEGETVVNWKIALPNSNWAIFDNVDLPTEGRKPQIKLGKVELQIKNNSGSFPMAATLFIVRVDTEIWNGTFSPSGLEPPKWQVGNIAVGEERDARIQLFKKKDDGSFEEIDAVNGLRSGKITKT